MHKNALNGIKQNIVHHQKLIIKLDLQQEPTNNTNSLLQYSPNKSAL